MSSQANNNAVRPAESYLMYDLVIATLPKSDARMYRILPFR